MDEEYAVSLTAASSTKQVRRVVLTLLATWSKTRRVVHVAGSMVLKIRDTTHVGRMHVGMRVFDMAVCNIDVVWWAYSCL